MKYTVLLLRPDYVADNFGQDTFLAHVDEPSVEAAEHAGRVEAYTADQSPDEREADDLDEKFEDYHVLFVAEGWLDDLASGG